MIRDVDPSLVGHYERFFAEQFTPARYASCVEAMRTIVGREYPCCTTPFFLRRDVLDRITSETIPALLELVFSSSYQTAALGGSRSILRPPPLTPRDATGAADFHVQGGEARLIELNIGLAGHLGMAELFPREFARAFQLPPLLASELRFEDHLVDLVTLGGDVRDVAIAVNHAGLGERYFANYQHVARIFRERGVHADVVFAKDAGIGADGAPRWNDRRYERVLQLVVPRVWEDDPQAFAAYTDLFHAAPERFFPNPVGSRLADKRLLVACAAIDEQQFGLDDETRAAIRAVTLRARLLASFNSADEAMEWFGGPDRTVLKPHHDFHSRGVHVQPDVATFRTVFDKRRDDYVAHEFFPPSPMPSVRPDGSRVDELRGMQIRVEFLEGELRGVRGYSFTDPKGVTPMTAVVLV